MRPLKFNEPHIDLIIEVVSPIFLDNLNKENLYKTGLKWSS